MVTFVIVGVPAVDIDYALIQRQHALGGLAQGVAEAGDGSVPVSCRVAGHSHGEEAQIGHLLRKAGLQGETLQFGHGQRLHEALCLRPQFGHVFWRTQHLKVRTQRHGFRRCSVPTPEDDGRLALLPVGAGDGAAFRFGDGPPQSLNLHVVIRLQRGAQAGQHRIGHVVILWLRPIKVGDEEDDLARRLGLLVEMVAHPARCQQGDEDQAGQGPGTPAGYCQVPLPPSTSGAVRLKAR